MMGLPLVEERERPGRLTCQRDRNDVEGDRAEASAKAAARTRIV